jgi:hypothetical protein
MKQILPLLLLPLGLAFSAEPISKSGIYPSLATFNEEGECGTGAVVPWADRVWVVSYAPHKPTGSTDKLYEITPDLQQIIRPESIGGTPANRMIHKESNQLFIGPYAISGDGAVRVIPYTKMFGRPTGTTRHLTDPANKVLFATMEEGIYEVDVKTLSVTELWADEQLKSGRHADLPGYHGKGFYSGQGRYIYANNGDHEKAALSNPATPSGVLAEWDGKADKWTVARRNQFTDVTGPGGISGSDKADDPIWSIGWDHRSLILMLLDHGKWHSYRLPKASHCYDGAHGWNTEWPRIRDIGEDEYLMTMHGEFWKFPKTFCAANTAGIAPRSTYLKVIGDFCRWKDRVVLGCDDAAKSEFLNKDRLKGNLAGPGQSQSNLWFIEPSRLDECGPALGRGAVWMNDEVKAGDVSEPMLFSGFTHRSLHLAQKGDEANTFTLEVDAKGDGQWTKPREVTVAPHGSAWVEFSADDRGIWIRITSAKASKQTTAFFHYRKEDARGTEAAPLFNGLATPQSKEVSQGVMLTRGGGFKTLRFVTPEGGCYDLDGGLEFKKADDPKGAAYTAKNAVLAKDVLTIDDASVLYVDDKGKRWRLPKGDASFDKMPIQRHAREICTERNLLNVHGTFYELPANNAGGFIKVRPITTHNRSIYDYSSYRGLLVMSGIESNAKGEHIIRSDDGKEAIWVGAVDDLWKMGKPRGHGGPWHESSVKAGEPSDPYLATGYDKKRMVLSHELSAPVTFHLEADFTASGQWAEVGVFTVQPAKHLEYALPDSFGAYWLRLTSESDAPVTAEFIYE